MLKRMLSWMRENQVGLFVLVLFAAAYVSVLVVYYINPPDDPATFRVEYVRDERTDLCYAVKRSGFAPVPCTPEVLENLHDRK